MNFTMLKYVIVLLLAAAVPFLINGCAGSTQGNVQDLETEIARLESENNDIRWKINRLESEIARYRSSLEVEGPSFEDMYEMMLQDLFTEDELRELAAERGLSYQLQVNNELVSGQEVVVTAGETLRIMILEVKTMSSDTRFDTLLPYNILRLAMLDDISGHIDLETEAEFFTTGAADTINEGLVFIFEKVEEGTTVKIIVSEHLRCRLGLNGSEIMVRVA